MSQPRDGRYDLSKLGAGGASEGDTLVFTNGRWQPGTSGASVTVSTTAPASPGTGDLWYDTDATC